MVTSNTVAFNYTNNITKKTKPTGKSLIIAEVLLLLKIGFILSSSPNGYNADIDVDSKQSVAVTSWLYWHNSIAALTMLVDVKYPV
jgi:hypothetical protein